MHSPEVLEKAGITHPGKDGKPAYDRFRNRVMFPFFDEQGRVVGFSGRVLGESQEAKYINSPETPVFHKSNFLCGLYFAKQHIRKLNFSILVEGQMDVIMAHQAGFPVAVASSGTAITEAQLQTLKRLSNRLVLALDADGAGFRATVRSATMALALGMEVKIAKIVGGKDPADMCKDNPEAFKQSVREAKPLVTFLLERLQEMYPEQSQDKIYKIKSEIIPIVIQCPDPILQEHYAQEIANALGVSKEVCLQTIRSAPKAVRAPVQLKKPDYVPQNANKRQNLMHRVGDAVAYLHEHTMSESIRSNLVELEKLLGEIPPGTGAGGIRYEVEYTDDTTRDAHVEQELDEKLRDLLKDIWLEEILKNQKEMDAMHMANNVEGFAKLQEECKNIQIRLKQLV